MTNLGLSKLAADSLHEFSATAVDLCANLEQLQSLRAGLRQRMIESPLMNAERIARNMENAYRQMWRNWCASRG